MNQYGNVPASHLTDDSIYGIVCEVTNCVYNEERNCYAEEITVSPQYANSSADTACATFKAR